MEIRKAGPSDIDAITDLMRDFAAFEDLSEYFEATPEKLAAVMFGESSFVNGLVAEDGAEVGEHVEVERLERRTDEGRPDHLAGGAGRGR